MFAKQHDFRPVPSEDQEARTALGDKAAFADVDDNAFQTSSKRYALVTKLTLLGSLFLVTCGLLILSVRFFTPQPWQSCGKDKATALKRGCSFDIISFAWQTPECFDGPLVNEFASWEGDWTFYTDKNFTQPVSQKTAMQGETDLFVKWDYHMVHCTFMWRQMHRAYERGWIDSHLGNYNHTLHCQKMILMDPHQMKDAATGARVIYPECRRTTSKNKGPVVGDPVYTPT